MAVKLLISGVSNSGKTKLTETLENALVFYHDGKNYPFKKPHVNIATFSSARELIDLFVEKISAYETKFGRLPETIVIDTVSKIFDTMLDNCNAKFTGFKVYSELNAEIHEFTDFVQNELIAGGMNVVIISHAIYDAETTSYGLVGKGDFSKRGGYLAEVDHATFIELKSNKRIIHHRSTKFPARTVLDSLPDNQAIDEYSLQEHINELRQINIDVSTYEL